MNHANCKYTFTVIVNEYLGQYFHPLVNFNFYENKIVWKEVALLNLIGSFGVTDFIFFFNIYIIFVVGSRF